MTARTAIALLLCLLLPACSREPGPEDQIRAVVAAAEEAAESRDASTLLELIAPDYQDGRGNGAEEIRRYVRGYLVTHQSIHLLTRVDEIEILATSMNSTSPWRGRTATGSSPELTGGAGWQTSGASAPQRADHPARRFHYAAVSLRPDLCAGPARTAGSDAAENATDS
jgi:hypothetical protein